MENDSAARRGRYADLSKKVYATHEQKNLDEVRQSKSEHSKITAELHNLVSSEIIAALSIGNLKTADLNKAITDVQAGHSMAAWGSDTTNTPHSERFIENGVQTVAVAYAVLHGGDAVPDTDAYLEFYDNRNGVWHLITEALTKSDFERRTFYVSSIKSGLPGETWFVVWGDWIASGNGLKIRLYSYNGDIVRTLWGRDDLSYGRIKVEPESITLDYDRAYNSPDPDNRVHEVLHVTPNGLE
jgi:hypothetical protein